MFQSLKAMFGYVSDRTPKTAGYEGSNTALVGIWAYNRKRPLFTNWLAQAMLADPHVQFGLYLIKGPILSGSRFLVTCQNEEQRQFIVKQINRFWTRSAKLALRSMQFGWYGAEVMYRICDGRLNFDGLINLSPNDTSPIVYNSVLSGIQVRMPQTITYLPAPKCFWTTHGREVNRWWGQSRLYGAHIPWYEYNANEGFRDSRRLFFYKNAFNGGVLYYPQGASTDVTGVRTDNRDIAQQIMDDFRNGSGMCLPRGSDAQNNWEWDAPQSQDVSASFTEYGNSLRDEVWEALGVPPEIAKAQGTGAYAGRQIPQEAFYSLLQEIVQDLIVDYDEQVIRPLVAMNFGAEHADYDIECFGLLRNLEEDRGNHKDDARQPLGSNVQGGGDQTKDAHLSNRSSQVMMSELLRLPAPYLSARETGEARFFLNENSLWTCCVSSRD
jgi:hypothetical protein